ncbi:GIY-YIG nuclease family protein [Psychroserpens luteolus]|uniref:GIY-YIG nuclease family protein n=1 Tax=Psychroserpens luteolus TaxID=2855840 RepID=UPI001E504FA9|nr:GIY-YIG nuclease family protein [Psychroserpens luteolus]MCD2257666.1 GIY-YIG nuclease family protein [Psychroserpens luteolus]
MYYVYVIRSEVDGRLYKGMTMRLDNRIKEHNFGKTKSTKGYLPWVLVYQEVFNTRREARLREKFLKSGQGRDYLKKVLAS